MLKAEIVMEMNAASKWIRKGNEVYEGLKGRLLFDAIPMNPLR